jgi:hypothetical protein
MSSFHLKARVFSSEQSGRLVNSVWSCSRSLYDVLQNDKAAELPRIALACARADVPPQPNISNTKRIAREGAKVAKDSSVHRDPFTRSFIGEAQPPDCGSTLPRVNLCAPAHTEQCGDPALRADNDGAVCCAQRERASIRLYRASSIAVANQGVEVRFPQGAKARLQRDLPAGPDSLCPFFRILSLIIYFGHL